MTYFSQTLKQLTCSIFFIFFLSSCTEPIEKLNAGEDCKRCDLSNADLSGLSLKDIDLTGADLSGANLSNTDMVLVNFTDAILKDADLSNSYLNSSIFYNSDLTNANLRNTDAKWAKFQNVNFTNASLEFSDFTLDNIINPIFKTSDNPSGDIEEASKLSQNSKKLTYAEKMLFDDFYGVPLIFSPDAGRYGGLEERIIRQYNLHEIIEDNGHSEELYGTDQDIYDIIDEYYDWGSGNYYTRPISDFICDNCSVNSATLDIDKYNFQDQDKELFKMILDTNTEVCPVCWNDIIYGETRNVLADYLYNYYFSLIEASKIKDCGYVEPSIKILKVPGRDEINTPKAALIIERNLQTASLYYKDVTAYNLCVSEAYKLYKSGIQSVQESAIRITYALNEPRYKKKISEDLEAQKREEETEKYRSTIYELLRKLYTFEDLVYPGYEDMAFQAAIQKRGLYKTIMTGGLDAEEIESIIEGRKNIFRNAMNNCLGYYWLREKNTKKRESIIEKLTKAAKNKNSDKEISKSIRECAYDANIAYISK